jgi:dihydroorotate dehydrogenase electron transfer subunit
MYLLAKELRRKKVETTLLYGAPTKNDILMIDEFKNLGLDVVIFTEDGSSGVKGMVSEGIKKNIVSPGSLVFACGPFGMLKRAYELLSPLGIDPLLSFDYRMACGFGVCLGCNIGVHDKNNNSVRQVSTCVEGPVFRGSEVAW